MSDDGTLKIGTQVNVGPLQQGMAQAQSTVKSAFSTMANDAEIWAKVSASGSMKAAEALDRYAKFAAEARAATEQLAVAEEKEATVLRGGMSARMAASAELRVLEGNFNGSTRAAGAFLTTLPGIGAAMQVAFPVFGLIALVEVLVKGVEAISKWRSALETLGETEAKFHAQMMSHSDAEFNVNRRMVESEYALAIAQAGTPVEKDRIRVQLQQALVSLGDRHVTQLKAAMVQLQGYGAAQKIVADTQRDIAKNALASGNLGLAAVMAVGSLRAGGQAGAAYSPGKDGSDSAMERNHKALEAAQAELNEVKAKGIADGQRITKDGLTADHKLEEEARKASEAVIKAQEALLLSKEAILGRSAELSSTFWATEVATTRKGSLEYTHALEAMQRAQAEIVSSTNAEKRRFATESAAAVSDLAAEQGKFDVAGIQNASKATNDWLRAVRDGAAIETANESILARASLKALEASGSISRLTAVQAEASLNAKEYSDRLAVLQAQLTAINEASFLSPMEKKGQAAGVQNQISVLKGAAAAQSANDAANAAATLVAPYSRAFESINQQWLQVQGRLIFGTRNVGREFGNMGANMVQSIAGHWEQMLAKWFETELRMLIIHTQVQTAQVGVTAQTQAASTAIHHANAIEQALINAKAAAVAAFRWGMDTPFPFNMVIAPTAAAGALAGAMALAAFETGGIVPNTGVALVHQGEAVLPRNLTNMLMNTANHDNRTSSSASMVNYFHGNTDSQFRDQMMRHSGHVLAAVHRGLRNKGRI